MMQNGKNIDKLDKPAVKINASKVKIGALEKRKLSDYIDGKRRERKMTIAEMSEVMGIDRNSYTRRMKGRGFYDAEILLAVSYFGENLIIQKVI